MSTIQIDVGVDTILEIDLSKVNFDDTQGIVFTIKNTPSIDSAPIVEKTFTGADLHKITITAEESVCIQDGAVYDFQKIFKDGTRIKLTDNGMIRLRYSVGDKID